MFSTYYTAVIQICFITIYYSIYEEYEVKDLHEKRQLLLAGAFMRFFY